jgi:hypothetical protein
MINPNELVRTRDRMSLAPATDAEIRQATRYKIEAVKRVVEKPIRMGDSMGFPMREELIVISGNSRLATIIPSGDVPLRGVQRAKGQELVLGVMREYGFNLNGPNHQASVGGSGRIYTELLDFPSETIPGLVFRRERDIIESSGRTCGVRWEARDMAPPGINLRRVLGRKPAATVFSAGR